MLRKRVFCLLKIPQTHHYLAVKVIVLDPSHITFQVVQLARHFKPNFISGPGSLWQFSCNLRSRRGWDWDEKRMRPDQTSRLLQWMTEREEQRKRGREIETDQECVFFYVCVCVSMFFCGCSASSLSVIMGISLPQKPHIERNASPVYSGVLQKTNICCLIVVWWHHDVVQRSSLGRMLGFVQSQRRNSSNKFKTPAFSLTYHG